jgi:hypothetical protein
LFRSVQALFGRIETVSAIVLTSVKVGLRGLPPGLLMASKRIMEADDRSGKKGVRRSHEQEAELHCHWTKAGKEKQLAVPWTNLYKSFCQAATYYKWQGQKSFADVVAATISCDRDMVPLGTKEYEVYVDWCRIPPRTGAMVQVARPRLREWACEFVMSVDAEMYGKGGIAVLKDIIAHAGKMVGVGPWRPQLRGPYGRFTVLLFEVSE